MFFLKLTLSLPFRSPQEFPTVLGDGRIKNLNLTQSRPSWPLQPDFCLCSVLLPNKPPLGILNTPLHTRHLYAECSSSFLLSLLTPIHFQILGLEFSQEAFLVPLSLGYAFICFILLLLSMSVVSLKNIIDIILYFCFTRSHQGKMWLLLYH